MYRTNTCGELRLNHVGQKVTLAGWVQRSRKMGGMTFVDLRDRYGITQLVFNQETDADLCDKANKLGREYVIQVTGTVTERSSKNTNLPTGEIEIIAENLVVVAYRRDTAFYYRRRIGRRRRYSYAISLPRFETIGSTP